MRKIAAIILLVLSTAALGCQNRSEWSRYTSAEGHYSVLFSGQPQLQTQAESAPDGGSIQQYLAITSESSGASYLVGYFDIGGRTYSFDKGRDGALSRVKGTLISERDIKLREYPGREVKLFGTAGGVELFSVVRFYRVEQRVFMVMYIVPKSVGQDLSDQAVKFFDSFQVQSH